MDRRSFLKQVGAIIGLATIPVGNLLSKSNPGITSELAPKPEIVLQPNRKYSEFPGLSHLINTGRIDTHVDTACGPDWTDLSYRFDGQMDGFYISGRALSDEEIKQLFYLPRLRPFWPISSDHHDMGSSIAEGIASGLVSNG